MSVKYIERELAKVKSIQLNSYTQNYRSYLGIVNGIEADIKHGECEISYDN